MSQINQPSNQIKLTNVSLVRLRKGGKRFEIACYKNKVAEFRSGVTKDLSEILQIEEVFLNVSKGQVAPKNDLQKCFGTADRDTVVMEILNKGEFQVGEKERNNRIEDLRREICNLVAEKTVNPESNRPYPPSMIEKAMAQIHFGVNTNKSSKSQALDLIKQLKEKEVLNIDRAMMRVRLTVKAKEGKRVKDKVLAMFQTVEEDDWGDDWEISGLIDPGQFRLINELIDTELKGKNARLETLNFQVHEEEEERIE
ncbi:Shwachman-Bodian-diamond syndrome protein [Atractiella rhizophila]|nr:Shwachman-Bodian-diamond syndrome protein [Atractiella rhizophila]